MNKFISVLHKY